jgi:ketosteroid isomerase-like protein
LRLAALALALTLSACAAAPGPRGGLQGGPPAGRPGFANPSQIVAAEIAFNRAAPVEGQWTAFAEFAADDAVMFVPQPVNAKEWLKGRADPPKSVTWQPHQVWMSCDGSLAASRGAWQRPDGSTGYFTTVWQRQEKGGYKWVMDQGDALPAPEPAPEMIAAKVADCREKPAVRPVVQLVDGDVREGVARDGTLAWHVWVRPDGKRRVSIDWWDGSAWQSAVAAEVTP